MLSYLLFKVIQLNCLLVLFAGNLIRKIKGTKSEADEFFGFDDVNKVSVLIIFLILLGLFFTLYLVDDKPLKYPSQTAR